MYGQSKSTTPCTTADPCVPKCVCTGGYGGDACEKSKEYMDEIGLESLDLCHYLDESMRKPLEEAIATAPKIKQKQAKTLLTDLWTRAEIFQRWDEDESGALDYMEVDKAINATFSREMIGLLLGKKNLQDRFNAIDTNKDGVISFGEMYREVRTTPNPCAQKFSAHSADGCGSARGTGSFGGC